MKSKVSILAFAVLLIFIHSQSGFSQSKLTGGSGGFHFGPKLYNTTNYNYFLEDGIANLNDNLLQFGGGGYMVYNNIILGGRGFYQGGETRDVTLENSAQDSQNYTYALNGGGGYLNVGYVVHSNESLLIFPQFGLGYETLVLEKILNEETPFDPKEALSAEYRWGSPMIDVAAGIDWFPFEKGGAKVGLRIGYSVSLQRNSDWAHKGGDFIDSNLPKNNLDGFYINISIGGGWVGKKK